MSCAVAERTRELGIRVALGERPRHIRARVLLEGLQLAALGSVLGAGAVWFVSRALRSLVFQVSVDDPWMVIGVAIVLTIVTILAADGPARRAGRVDPITAIRGR